MCDSTLPIFQPLSNSQPEFRLPHLQPIDTYQQENGFTHIFGNLSIESIPRSPAYEALSYVWGDASGPINITINGVDFSVTRSLYQALKHMMLVDKVRVVWVDVICINQADLDERSQQVRQMRYIYPNANSVSVFLGDPYDGIKTTLQYLSLSAEDGSLHLEPGLHPQLSVGGLDANSDELAEALVKLFCLPWWRRLWTVQG
jgi:hypothetical protein